MKEEKFDWNDSGSIRVPTSVVKQLDEYKRKHGYTSRPQAIISAIERAGKVDLVEEIKKLLKVERVNKMKKIKFELEGYLMTQRIVMKDDEHGKVSRIDLPVNWAGKKVVVILIDEL